MVVPRRVPGPAGTADSHEGDRSRTHPKLVASAVLQYGPTGWRRPKWGSPYGQCAGYRLRDRFRPYAGGAVSPGPESAIPVDGPLIGSGRPDNARRPRLSPRAPRV